MSASTVERETGDVGALIQGSLNRISDAVVSAPRRASRLVAAVGSLNTLKPRLTRSDTSFRRVTDPLKPPCHVITVVPLLGQPQYLAKGVETCSGSIPRELASEHSRCMNMRTLGAFQSSGRRPEPSKTRSRSRS